LKAVRDGHKGDNVVDKLEEQAKILADKTQPKEKRAGALKWVVHLAGDLHQPLHCADRNGDRGGNTPLVFYPGKRTPGSLHFVWDTLLLRDVIGRRPIAQVADDMEKQITAPQRSSGRRRRRSSGRTKRTAWRSSARIGTCRRTGHRRGSTYGRRVALQSPSRAVERSQICDPSNGDAVITGSFNFTKQAETDDAENLLIIEGKPRLGAAYAKNFDRHMGHSKRFG
jgi:hypothetical protein